MNTLLLAFGAVVAFAATIPHRPWIRLVLVAVGLGLIAAAVFWT